MPASPESLEAKRGRHGDTEVGKPLFAFAAIHSRQDVTDNEVMKLKNELLAMRTVLDSVVKEAAHSSSVESLKSEVQALRDEVKGGDVAKLTEDLRACFGAIEVNDVVQ